MGKELFLLIFSSNLSNLGQKGDSNSIFWTLMYEGVKLICQVDRKVAKNIPFPPFIAF